MDGFPLTPVKLVLFSPLLEEKHGRRCSWHLCFVCSAPCPALVPSDRFCSQTVELTSPCLLAVRHGLTD